ncbi:E3 ubiquitin/ISG15 ligase TRIM25 [Nibea albiflora]|uniref:E3 ubiquitin/ISG15 ligase TRIM25 n=1 Tax=Nibea albiflora TaxID=240163 RepID=A0ACB7EVM3_NIBAL|nr:E3 ubiquitin/ISG15 ligase TRIM25 [Nibea albiflora]
MSSSGVFALLPEDNFQCSICLNVFDDPVTTPCGHNFCKTCLSERWDKSDLCCCPECNKRFHVRPEISTNTVIEEISVQLKRRRVETPEMVDAPWQVRCDVCTEIKFQALKSCLVCLTSYCEAHLEPSPAGALPDEAQADGPGGEPGGEDLHQAPEAPGVFLQGRTGLHLPDLQRDGPQRPRDGDR